MAIELKSPEARAELLEQVVTNWDDMRRERSQLEATWDRCLMAYLCEFDKAWATTAKAANRSCRYVGISWDAVETLVPQIYDAMFGMSDWLKIRPQRAGYDQNDDIWAENQKYLCLYQHRQTGFNPTIKLGIKSLLAVGNCPWTMEWVTQKAPDYGKANDAMMRWLEESAAYHDEKEQLRKDWIKGSLQSKLMGGEALPAPQTEAPPAPPKDLDVIYDGPRLSIGSIYDYVQEQYPNDESGALRIMRTFRTKAHLKKLAKPTDDGYIRYSNLGAIKDMGSEENAKDTSAEHLFKQALGMTLPHGKNKIELKSQYGTFELNGAHGEKRVYENYVVVVANDHQIIQCEPASLWSGKPVVQNAKLITYANSVYGIGIIEKALPEQDTTNAILNQTIDATNTVIQPEYEVVEDDLVDGVMAPSGPGVRHRVNVKGSITPIQKNYTGIPIGAEQVQMAISRHERITGATNTGPAAEESATRTARNSGIIATKLGGHVTAIEDGFITQAINMQLEMNAQYIDNEQVFAFTQDNKIIEVKIQPEDVRRGAVAYAAGSKYMAEKQERIQNLMTATQLATELAANGPTPVKTDKLYRVLFSEILGDEYDIMKSSEEYEAELQQFQQQMMMQQQMEAQGGQGNEAGGPGQAGGGAEPGTSGAPV